MNFKLHNYVGLIVALAVLFTTITCDKDNPVVPEKVEEISKYIGGAGYDWGTTLLESADNNIVIAGSTDSYGEGKNTLYVVKTTPLGDTLWTRIYGGNGDDNAEAMDYTADGGYIISGTSSSFNGYDFYLLKIDDNGNKAWEKSIGKSDYFEWSNGVVTVPDGYVMAGYSIPPKDSNDFGNIYLVKTDLNGELIWEKYFGGDGFDWAFSLSRCVDGGFIIAGYSNSFSNDDLDLYLIKTSANGDLEWEQTYGATYDERGYDVIQTSDGGFIACGSTRSYGDHSEQTYIVKTNQNGGKEWSRVISGEGSLFARDIFLTSHNSYLITGATMMTDGFVSYTELDLGGNIISQKSINGLGTGMEIFETSTGDYIITGFGYPKESNGNPDLLFVKKIN